MLHRNSRILYRLIQNVYRSLFTANNHFIHRHPIFPNNTCILRTFATSHTLQKKSKNVPSKDDADTWKIDHDAKLFDSKDLFIGIMPIAEAETYAKHHSSKLVLLGDEADNLKSYRLQKLDEEGGHHIDKENRQKLSKTFRVKTKIDPHDLGIKIGKIRSALEKGIPISVNIYSATNLQTESYQKQNEVMKKITEALKDIASVNKAQRTETLCSFNLTPVNIK